MTVDVSASAAADEVRRGRKRGKHNFEPGYKDLLCKEWTDFMATHNRCPKAEEIENFSKKSFNQRRRDLEDEDPNHPLLVILECPLDAIQVKNLINNEKKKRQRMRPTAVPPGGLPLSVFHGLPMKDAAMIMKDWLQSVNNQAPSTHHGLSPSGAGSLQPSILTPIPVSCSLSDQSCDAGIQKTPTKAQRSPNDEACGSPTCHAQTTAIMQNTLSNAVSVLPDTLSEDESESHESECLDKTGFSFHLRQHSHQMIASPVLLDGIGRIQAPEIRHCTAAEALCSIMQQSPGGASAEFTQHPSQSPPSELLSPPALSLGPSAANVVSAPAATVVHQFIAAMASTNHVPQAMIRSSPAINVPQINQIVQSAVAEQVQKLFSQQMPQLSSPLTPQETHQHGDISNVHQFLSAMQLLQNIH